MTRQRILRILIAVVSLLVAFIVMELWANDNARKAARVSALIADLDSRDRAVRDNASRVILEGTDRRLIRGLIDALADKSKHGKLVPLLVSKGESAVRPLVSALGRGPSAWNRLLRKVRFLRSADPSPFIPEGAAEALAAIGKPALPAVLKALRSSNAETRGYAAGILGRIADPRAVEPLIAALKDKDPSVVCKAAWSLGELKDLRAAKPLAALLAAKDSATRLSAVAALAAMGDKPSLEPVAALLSDPDLALRRAAAFGLGAAGDPRAVPELIDAYLKGDRQEQVRAARLLGDLKDPRAVEPLIAAMQDEKNEERVEAIWALWKIGDTRAIDPLIALLEKERNRAALGSGDTLAEMRDPSLAERAARRRTAGEDVRRGICSAFEHFKDPRAFDALVAALDDESARVEAAAAWGLVALYNDPRVVNVLIKALGDRNSDVRATAIAGLIASKDARSVDLLCRMLKDRSDEIKVQAATALGNLGDKRAVEPLCQALSDPDERVRSNAESALINLPDERSVEPLIAAIRGKAAPEQACIAHALLAIGSPRAVAAVDSMVEGIDVAEVARNYKNRLKASVLADELPLTVALVRYGNLGMAEDFYWCTSGSLHVTAEWWALTKGLIRKLHESKDSPERPRWTDKPDLQRRLDELADRDPAVRAAAAGRLGVRLEVFAPKIGTPLFDRRKPVAKNGPASWLQSAQMPFGLAAEQPEAWEREQYRGETTRADIDKIVAALTAALADSDPAVRGTAADALGWSKDVAVIEPLTRTLADADQRVRISAIWALSRIRDDRALQPLIGLLTDAGAAVRANVVMALGEERAAGAAEPLMRALKDKEASVRVPAAISLAATIDARAVPALSDALKDADARVKAAAAISLANLQTGEAFAAIDAAGGRYDLKQIATDYGNRIRSGGEAAVTPLILALARYGTGAMAEDFYWSGQKDLADAAVLWKDLKHDFPALEATQDSKGRPKWPGAAPSVRKDSDSK